MGGVYADATPQTMPSIPNVLNRFSRQCSGFFVQCYLISLCVFAFCEMAHIKHFSATMNQLYHPARTAAFFNMLAANEDISVFTVTNNVVHDLMTFADAEKKHKTFEGIAFFLASNGLDAAKFPINSVYCVD